MVRFLRNIDEQTVIGQELGQFSTKDTVLYFKNRILTQNGIPVKVKDTQFKTVICDKDFSKDGYRIGEIFRFFFKFHQTAMFFLNTIEICKDVKLK